MIRTAHIIVSSILLWMLGLLMLSLIKGMFLERELQANASYIVELSPNVLPGQRITAESLLKDMDGIVPSSVTHISKSEALEMMMKDYPGLASSEWENPFREILTFRTASIAGNELEVLKANVEKIPGVSAMYYEREVYSGLTAGIARFRMALLILTSVLFLAVVVMIIYAIRQRLSSNRAAMRIRTLSGVLDKDIMRPYLTASVQEGFLAGIIAAGMLVLNILLINGNLLRGVEISFLQTLVTCICVILISLALYYITTALTSRRFLQSI